MKKLFFRISILCIGASLLVSCNKKKESLTDTFVRINQEVLQNSKAYATLKEATATLGHRLTGSENGHKAEEYTYNKFKEYGFEDVKFQEFEVEAWSRGDVSVTIDTIVVPAVTLGHSPVRADVTGKIVKTEKTMSSEFTFEKSAIQSGIYFLKITENTGQSSVHKIIFN